jgi:ribonucleoside-triphosphate reductase
MLYAIVQTTSRYCYCKSTVVHGCEISLRPNTFCNLTEIDASQINSQEEFDEAARVAAFFGTLQAGFTDFHYLRSIWKTNTEKDALIGVGITGIANGTLDNLNLESTANIVKETNKELADRIDIKQAARTTTVKPSGTTSCVLGTSSGIHAWHSKHYIRNMQCAVGDDLYNFFNENHPELIKVMDYQPDSAVIGIPQEAPDGAVLRENESALEMLERVKDYNLNWVRKGHRRGPNTNNVSATVSVKRTYKTDDNGNIIKDENNKPVIKFDEWLPVGEWMWNNRDTFNGLSVLPYDGGTYKDAPFMEVTEDEFYSKVEYIENHPIDLTKIVEEEDATDLAAELACFGSNCDVEF